MVRLKGAGQRGKPIVICSENGPEYISAAIQTWATEWGISLECIKPGNPQQNSYVEKFNTTVSYESFSNITGPASKEFKSLLPGGCGHKKISALIWLWEALYQNIRLGRMHNVFTSDALAKGDDFR